MKFINRAKDELVTPDDFDAFVAREQRIFEDRYGSYADAVARLLVNGNLAPVRGVRSAYAGLRRSERAEAAGKEVEYDANEPMKTADREARRTVAGTGGRCIATRSPRNATRRSTRSPTPTSRTARRSR